MGGHPGRDQSKDAFIHDSSARRPLKENTSARSSVPHTAVRATCARVHIHTSPEALVSRATRAVRGVTSLAVCPRYSPHNVLTQPKHSTHTTLTGLLAALAIKSYFSAHDVKSSHLDREEELSIARWCGGQVRVHHFRIKWHGHVETASIVTRVHVARCLHSLALGNQRTLLSFPREREMERFKVRRAKTKRYMYVPTCEHRGSSACTNLG